VRIRRISSWIYACEKDKDADMGKLLYDFDQLLAVGWFLFRALELEIVQMRTICHTNGDVSRQVKRLLIQYQSTKEWCPYICKEEGSSYMECPKDQKSRRPPHRL
jgi:hypothetical protein